MRRVWWLFCFFVLGAFIDLVGTILNLFFLGYGFEGNPLINNWYSAVLVKVLLLCLVGWSIHKYFEKSNLVNKYAFISLFIIGGLVQLMAGSMHLYVYSQYVDSDRLIITERGDVLVINKGVVSQTLSPEVEGVKKLHYYLSIVSVFVLYPYIVGLICFRLFLWVLGIKSSKTSF